MNSTSYSSIPSDPNVKPQESLRQSPLVCTTQCFFIGQDPKKKRNGIADNNDTQVESNSKNK